MYLILIVNINAVLFLNPIVYVFNSFFLTFYTGSKYWEEVLAGHFLGFSVYVSNTTDISQGTLCFKDNNFFRNTIPSVFTTVFTNCFAHGQYVIYFNERIPGVVYPTGYDRYVRSDLCEVEVFGERSL